MFEQYASRKVYNAMYKIFGNSQSSEIPPGYGLLERLSKHDDYEEYLDEL